MLIAALCRVAATILFATMMVLVKCSIPIAGGAMTYFLRGLFAVPIILLVMVATRQFPAGVMSAKPLGHGLRGLLAAASLGCTYGSISLLPVSVAAALAFLAPLFVLLGAGAVVHEKVSKRSWIAVLIGGIGVVVAASADEGGASSLSTMTIGVACGVMGALLMAASMLQLRRLAATESAATLALYFSVAVVLAGGGALAYEGAISVAHVPLSAVLAGLAGGAGQMLLAESMRRAPASQLAPYDYLILIWTTIWDSTQHPVDALALLSPILIGLAVVIATLPGRAGSPLSQDQVNHPLTAETPVHGRGT